MRSSLEIFDLETGQAMPVLQTDRLIEAPNWDAGANALIVNGEGGLFEVPLDTPDLHPLETHGCGRLNNDHGLSPDCSLIAFSDHTAENKSVIYTVDRKGGVPKRVTSLAPSWWHGWSPDGKRLAYTAVREGQFCIATCALDGSDERVLITSAHHYDGPDYSPCGTWIWFNSDRGGDMRLWRMRTDGSAAQVMTDGAFVAWFPHPAPVGDHILYLAYAPGTEGHPRDRDVSLRLIDAGGEDRHLLSLFGGQGTINVPCWAPDGKRFAFMRYEAA
jgi:Tol biopolymer transport system component